MTKIKIQRKPLLTGHHNNTEINTDVSMTIPPIVGVPFFAKCVWGPFDRIGCAFFNAFIFLISVGIQVKQSKKAVKKAIKQEIKIFTDNKEKSII